MMFEESYTLQAEYARILPLNFSHSKIIKKYILEKKSYKKRSDLWLREAGVGGGGTGGRWPKCTNFQL